MPVFEYHHREVSGAYRATAGEKKEITVYERDGQGVLRFLAHVPVDNVHSPPSLERAIMVAMGAGVLPNKPVDDVTIFALNRIGESEHVGYRRKAQPERKVGAEQTP